VTATCNPQLPILDRFRRLFAAATRDAAEAMRRWIGHAVRLTLEEVRQLPLDDACAALEVGAETMTTVVLTIEGEYGGVLLLLFDDDNGRRLADSLLGKTPDGAEWTELERSALTETGNIFGCAYFGEIARLIDRPLMPTPPMFVRDYGASVLQQALAEHAASDEMLVCRTRFRHEEVDLSWLLVFIPTVSLCEAMEKAFDDPA
jgi:chemotaxis protein CheC